MTLYPAFCVPAGPRHSTVWITRRLAAKQGLVLPDCIEEHVLSHIGWYFRGYEFQRAIDVATAKWGGGVVSLLRNVTLTPLSGPTTCPVIYGAIAMRDLRIDSGGRGPFALKLHRGGAGCCAPRCLLLTQGACSVRIEQCIIAPLHFCYASVVICISLRAKADDQTTDATVLLSDVQCDSSLELVTRSSSLQLYRVLRETPAVGDELVASKSHVYLGRCIYEGDRGLVQKVRGDALGGCFEVLWLSRGESFLLPHRSCQFLDLYRPAAAPYSGPSSGSVS